MRYPSGINEKNRTLGFAAPSFGCATEPYRSAFDRALDKWHRAGVQTKLGPNCYASDGIGISNTPEKCGQELTEMYCSTDCDALISCGGGELMCEILDYVDFDRIAEADPKWFMGYSDNTNFTFTLTTMCDVASVYGPCAASFGSDDDHQSLRDALSILEGTGNSDRSEPGRREEREKVYERGGAEGGNKKNKENGVECAECHEIVYKFNGYGRWESESLRDEDHPLAGYNLNETTHVRRFAGLDNSDFEKSDFENPDFENLKSVTCLQDENSPMEAGPLTAQADRIYSAHGYNEPSKLVMDGRLIGGCLDCLVNLCGTRYDHVSQYIEKYRKDGILWYLEACDLNVLSIRRALWELKSAGWFEGASGFIFGRPLHFAEEIMGLDQYNAVVDCVGQYGAPILMDADIGHLSPMVPLINGSLAHVESEGNNWTIRMTLK